MTALRRCDTCGAVLEGRQRRFCSQPCGARHSQLKPTEPLSPDARATERIRRALHEDPDFVISCAVCGRHFRPPALHADDLADITCSPVCYRRRRQLTRRGYWPLPPAHRDRVIQRRVRSMMSAGTRPEAIAAVMIAEHVPPPPACRAWTRGAVLRIAWLRTANTRQPPAAQRSAATTAPRTP